MLVIGKANHPHTWWVGDWHNHYTYPKVSKRIMQETPAGKIDCWPRASLIIDGKAPFRWVKMTEEKGDQMCGRTILKKHRKVKGECDGGPRTWKQGIHLACSLKAANPHADLDTATSLIINAVISLQLSEKGWATPDHHPIRECLGQVAHRSWGSPLVLAFYLKGSRAHNLCGNKHRPLKIWGWVGLKHYINSIFLIQKGKWQ